MRFVKFRQATHEERYIYVDPAHVCRISEGPTGEWRDIYIVDGSIVCVTEALDDVLKVLSSD
jgi:hypothetical protein